MLPFNFSSPNRGPYSAHEQCDRQRNEYRESGLFEPGGIGLEKSPVPDGYAGEQQRRERERSPQHFGADQSLTGEHNGGYRVRADEIGDDLIYLACFAPLAINARAGVKSVSIEQIHAAYSMGASRNQIIWQVVVKAALPEILTGMRVSIAFGWTTLVAAEMVAAKAGLGVMVLNAARFLATDIVFLGIVVIGLLAFLFDLLMRRIERLLVPWKGKM